MSDGLKIDKIFTKFEDTVNYFQKAALGAKKKTPLFGFGYPPTVDNRIADGASTNIGTYSHTGISK